MLNNIQYKSKKIKLHIFNINKIFYFFLITFYYISCCYSLSDNRIFLGNEKNIKIEPAKQNYYLSSIIGESDYYNYDYLIDKILTVNKKAVVYFSSIDNKITDYFFYISNQSDIEYCLNLFKSKENIEIVPLEIIEALEKYQDLNPSYKKENLHKIVAELIKKITHTTLEYVLGEYSKQNLLDDSLYQYLRSNNIKEIKDIENNNKIIQMLINKFFILQTTYFYRDWAYIKEFKNFLKIENFKGINNKTPFKLKVYACSTGEEVLTYAIELKESGIDNFTILASDINDTSLEIAKNMKYPHNAFARLPVKKMEIIKKYFKLNISSNIYELKDPSFFQSRTKFVHQNILEPLPDNLGNEFAPPYDMVSILNVLLYLKAEAINKTKNYWKDIIKEGGILILKDAKYSLAKGDLGKDWSFENFLMINEWINIKASYSMEYKQKIEAYEKRFKNSSEIDYQLLTRGYSLNNEPDKIVTTSINYLNNNPYSFQAISSLIVYYEKMNDIENLNKTINDLCYYHSDQLETLNIILSLNHDTSSYLFLKKLKEKYPTFLMEYRNNPEKSEKLFDFDHPKSLKWDIIRQIIKINANNLMINFYAKENNLKEVERLSNINLNTLKLLSINNQEYLVLTKLMHYLINQVIPFYTDRNKDKILNICEEALYCLNNFNINSDYFYLNSSLGYLYLQKSSFENKNVSQKKYYLNDSVKYFERSIPYLKSIHPLQISLILGNIGFSYMERGRCYLQNEEENLASKDFEKAFKMFEKALEINPIYAKNIASYRNNLFKISKDNSFSKKT